jgi:hypothetical protein
MYRGFLACLLACVHHATAFRTSTNPFDEAQTSTRRNGLGPFALQYHEFRAEDATCQDDDKYVHVKIKKLDSAIVAGQKKCIPATAFDSDGKKNVEKYQSMSVECKSLDTSSPQATPLEANCQIDFYGSNDCSGTPTKTAYANMNQECTPQAQVDHRPTTFSGEFKAPPGVVSLTSWEVTDPFTSATCDPKKPSQDLSDGATIQNWWKTRLADTIPAAYAKCSFIKDYCTHEQFGRPAQEVCCTSCAASIASLPTKDPSCSDNEAMMALLTLYKGKQSCAGAVTMCADPMVQYACQSTCGACGTPRPAAGYSLFRYEEDENKCQSAEIVNANPIRLDIWGVFTMTAGVGLCAKKFDYLNQRKGGSFGFHFENRERVPYYDAVKAVKVTCSSLEYKSVNTGTANCNLEFFTNEDCTGSVPNQGPKREFNINPPADSYCTPPSEYVANGAQYSVRAAYAIAEPLLESDICDMNGQNQKDTPDLRVWIKKKMAWPWWRAPSRCSDWAEGCKQDDSYGANAKAACCNTCSKVAGKGSRDLKCENTDRQQIERVIGWKHGNPSCELNLGIFKCDDPQIRWMCKSTCHACDDTPPQSYKLYFAEHSQHSKNCDDSSMPRLEIEVDGNITVGTPTCTNRDDHWKHSDGREMFRNLERFSDNRDPLNGQVSSMQLLCSDLKAASATQGTSNCQSKWFISKDCSGNPVATSYFNLNAGCQDQYALDSRAKPTLTTDKDGKAATKLKSTNPAGQRVSVVYLPKEYENTKCDLKTPVADLSVSEMQLYVAARQQDKDPRHMKDTCSSSLSECEESSVIKGACCTSCANAINSKPVKDSSCKDADDQTMREIIGHGLYGDPRCERMALYCNIDNRVKWLCKSTCGACTQPKPKMFSFGYQEHRSHDRTCTDRWSGMRINFMANGELAADTALCVAKSEWSTDHDGYRNVPKDVQALSLKCSSLSATSSDEKGNCYMKLYQSTDCSGNEIRTLFFSLNAKCGFKPTSSSATRRLLSDEFAKVTSTYKPFLFLDGTECKLDSPAADETDLPNFFSRASGKPEDHFRTRNSCKELVGKCETDPVVRAACCTTCAEAIKNKPKKDFSCQQNDAPEAILREELHGDFPWPRTCSNLVMFCSTHQQVRWLCRSTCAACAMKDPAQCRDMQQVSLALFSHYENHHLGTPTLRDWGSCDRIRREDQYACQDTNRRAMYENLCPSVCSSCGTCKDVPDNVLEQRLGSYEFPSASCSKLSYMCASYDDPLFPSDPRDHNWHTQKQRLMIRFLCPVTCGSCGQFPMKCDDRTPIAVWAATKGAFSNCTGMTSYCKQEGPKGDLTRQYCPHTCHACAVAKPKPVDPATLDCAISYDVRNIDGSYTSSEDVNGKQTKVTKTYRTKMIFFKSLFKKDPHFEFSMCPKEAPETKHGGHCIICPYTKAEAIRRGGGKPLVVMGNQRNWAKLNQNRRHGDHASATCGEADCPHMDYKNKDCGYTEAMRMERCPSYHDKGCCPGGTDRISSVFYLKEGSNVNSPEFDAPSMSERTCVGRYSSYEHAGKLLEPSERSKLTHHSHDHKAGEIPWHNYRRNLGLSKPVTTKLITYKEFWSKAAPGGELADQRQLLTEKLNIHFEDSCYDPAVLAQREARHNGGHDWRYASGRNCTNEYPTGNARDKYGFNWRRGVTPKDVTPRRSFTVPAGKDDHQSGVFLAPFKNDIMSQHFATFTDSTKKSWERFFEESQVTDPNMMFVPWTFAQMRNTAPAGAENQCELLVTLEDSDEEEELVSVDGVDWSCLMGANPGTDGEVLALDIMQVLNFATGSSPGKNETMKVVTKTSSGVQRVRYTKATYAKHRRLEGMFEGLRQKDYWHRRPCNPRERFDMFGKNTTCTRRGVDVSQRQGGLEKMIKNLEDGIVTGLMFQSVTNLQTGEAVEHHDWQKYPLDLSRPGCKIRLHGVKDRDGLDQCSYPYLYSDTPKCTSSAMEVVSNGLAKTMSKMNRGDIKAVWQAMLPYTTSDAWFGCADLVERSLTFVEEQVKGTVTTCKFRGPWDKICWRQHESVEMYCDKYPNDKWCASCHCYFPWRMRERQCCSPTEGTFPRQTPRIDEDKVSALCKHAFAGTEAQKQRRSTTSIVSSATISRLTAALGAMKLYGESSTGLEKCFKDKEDKETKLAQLDNVGMCCYQAVVGTWTNGKKKSIQMCSTNEDCYSGVCDIPTTTTTTASTAVPTATSNCFASADTDGKKYFCASVDGETAGLAMTTCFTEKLSAVTAKAPSLLREFYAGGNQSASDQQVAQSIWKAASVEDCVGETGHLYNPRDFCQYWNHTAQKCQPRCVGNADCRAKCTQQKRCNWNSNAEAGTGTGQCSDSSAPSSTCIQEHGWGWREPRTRLGYCQINGNKKHFCSTERTANCVPFPTGLSDDYKHRYVGWTEVHINHEDRYDTINHKPRLRPGIVEHLMPTGQCEAFGAVRKFKGSNQENLFCSVSTTGVVGGAGYNRTTPNPIINFTRSTVDPNTDQSACYDECLNVLKPTQEWFCTRPSVDRKCPSGYKLEGIQGHWPEHYLPRPTYCRPRFRWEGGRYHWHEIRFRSQADATAGCNQIDSQSTPRLIRDGSNRCGESFCVNPSIAAEDECYRLREKVRNWYGGMAPYDRAWIWWDKDLNYGQGMCRMAGMNIHTDEKGCTSDGHIRKWNGQSNQFTCATGWSPQGSGWSRKCCAGAGSANPYKKHHHWGVGEDDVSYQRELCEGNAFNGSLILGRRFEMGKFDTQAKCEGSYCNVADPYWSWLITPQMCGQIQGKCDRYQCEGCQRDWRTFERQSEDDKIHSICYQQGLNQTQCDSQTDGEWVFANVANVTSQSYCFRKNRGRSECAYEYVNCEDLPSSSCADPKSPKYAGAALMFKDMSKKMICRISARMQCKSQEECSKAGECHGGLRKEYCYSTQSVGGTNWEHECKQFSHVCVKPQARAAGHWHESCEYLKRRLPNRRHDDKIHHFHDKCIDLHNDTKSECEQYGGQWHSTFTNSTICLADKRCRGKQGEHFNKRSDSVCTQCGGLLESKAFWEGAKWKQPNMVASPMKWVTRAMESTNSWKKVVYEDGLRDVINLFRGVLQSESEGSFTSCMYGKQSAALRSVAGACGSSGNTRRATPSLDAPYLLAQETTYPGNTDMVGNSKQSNFEVAGNTFTATTEVTMYEAPYLPQGSSSIDASNKQILTSSATMYDASCYTAVTNTNNKLVGQLVGLCVQVVAGRSFAAPGQLCFAPQDVISVNPAFTTADFASRTGTTPENYVYRPLTMSVAQTTGQLCASISANGWYCPVRRISSWSSATQDTGTRSCEAIDSLVARAQLAQNCASGDAKACATKANANKTVADTKTMLDISWGNQKAAAPVASAPIKVQQAITIAISDASQYTGELKTACETGYGIMLEIYDKSSNSYHTGCSVTSSVPARRSGGVAVNFQATVSMQKAAVAQSGATQLAASGGATKLTEKIKEAKETLSLTSVTVPTVAAIAAPVTDVAPPPTPPPTPVPTKGSSSTTSGGGITQNTPAGSSSTPGGDMGTKPAEAKLVHRMTFTHLGVNDWIDDTVTVYNIGYGISIKIYTTASGYKAGCSVTSTATAARRAGLAVKFEATMPAAEAANAHAAAKTISATTMAGNIASANTHLKNSGAITGTVKVPTKDDISSITPPSITGTSAPTAAPTAAKTASDSSSSSMLLIIIIGAIVAVVCVGGAIGVYCYMSASKTGAETAKEVPSDTSQSDKPHPDASVVTVPDDSAHSDTSTSYQSDALPPHAESSHATLSIGVHSDSTNTQGLEGKPSQTELEMAQAGVPPTADQESRGCCNPVPRQ